MAFGLTIALDATYGVGDQLSGVGLYSHEILWGLAAAHPEVRFHFAYRPHRYFRSWQLSLPRNVRRRPLIEPLSPRGADLFHGLNQRLPRLALRRAVATFHDLFVMTGEYSTPEFRARFTAQARDGIDVLEARHDQLADRGRGAFAPFGVDDEGLDGVDDLLHLGD